jgi:hypothetical protein
MSRARRDPAGSLENGAVIVGVGLAGHQLKTQLPISVRSGRRVESVDRDRREVLLGPGQVLRYEQLVLATGVQARTLDVSGLPLAGVCILRMLHDAQLLRRRLATPKTCWWSALDSSQDSWSTATGSWWTSSCARATRSSMPSAT